MKSDYEQQLAGYDQAFAAFFERLAAHGIDKSNTLFVVTVDEGDHFAGGVSSRRHLEPHVLQRRGRATTCPANQIGEVNLNLNSVSPRPGDTPPTYSVHSDAAPTVYVNGNPARTDPALRGWSRTSPPARPSIRT